MSVEIESNCTDVRWAVPVPIATRNGLAIEIHGPQQALNALMQVWPDKDGEHFSRSRNLCMAALA